MLSPRFIALCLIIHGALARPSIAVPQLKSIPADAAKLAYDADRRVTIAYDLAGHVMGEITASSYEPQLARRDAGTCANVNTDDVQRLDGFQLLSDYAKANWGDGWKEILANPTDWPDRGANACVSGDVAQVTTDGDPNCVTQSQSTEGTIVGASGSVALAAMQGTSSSTQVTVTKQAQVAVGASVSTKLSIPEIAEITASFTTTVTLTNTLSTANTFTVNNQVTQTVTLQSTPGQTCRLDFDVHTCNANGHGQQKMITHGWLWFHYDKKRDDHYYWAVNMDVVIPNEDQRSASIEFQTSTSSNTNSKYNAVCEGGEETSSVPSSSEPAPTSSEPAPTTSSPVETPTEPAPTDIPTTSPPAETTSTDVPTETTVSTEAPVTETASTDVPTETTSASEPPVTTSTDVPLPTEATSTDASATTETAVLTTSTNAPTTTALPPTPSDCMPALHNGMSITQNGQTFIVFKMD